MTATFPGPGLLLTFVEKHGIKVKDACEALSISKVTFWVHRKASPQGSSRRDIAIWTRGEVPEDSWGPLPDKRGGDRPLVEPFSPTDPGAPKGDAA